MIRTPFFVAVILSVSAGIRIYRIRHTPSSVLLSPSTVSLSSVLCLSVSLSLCLSVLRPPSSVSLSLCLSVSPSLRLSVSPSLRLSVLPPPSSLLRPPSSVLCLVVLCLFVSPSSSVFLPFSVLRLSVLRLSVLLRLLLSLHLPPSSSVSPSFRLSVSPSSLSPSLSSVLRPPSSVLRPPSSVSLLRYLLPCNRHI